MRIHNPRYLEGSYRFNGSFDEVSGDVLDSSGHDRNMLASSSDTPSFAINDLGKSSNEFKNGYPIAQRLDKVTSTGLPVDRIGSVGLPTFTNNGCKKFDGFGDKLVCNTALTVGTSDFEMGVRFRCRTDPMVSLTSCIWGDGTDIGGTMTNKGRVWIIAGGGGIFPYVNSTMGTVYYNGATPGAPITIGSEVGITNYHTLIIKRVGTSLQWVFNGVVRSVVTCLASDEFFVGRKPSIYFSNPEVTHAWFDVAGTRVVEYTFAAGPALTEWNRVGNSAYDGTYKTTSGINTMATTSDNATPWNILNGFSVAAMGDGTSYYQTTIRPTLSDKLEIQFNGNSISTNDAIIGVYDAADGTKRFLLYSDGNRYLSCIVGGTLTVLSQTAILDNMWHTVIIDCVAQTVKLDDAAPVAINITGLALTSDLRVFGSIGADVSVALCSYIKYWQSGILTQHLRPNRKGELVNVLNGIKATTVGTGITIQYIPSIVDRSVDVLGNEVMYPGRMSIHNGAESMLTQTDSDLLTNEFWSSDGITFDDKTYDDLLACDGSQGVYVSNDGSNISEILTEIFDGTDPKNIIGYEAEVGSLDQFTLSGTFRCDDWFSSRSHSICALYDGTGSQIFKVKLSGVADKTIQFVGSSDSIGNTLSTDIVNNGSIHTFACTFDGEDWNVYVDGYLSASVTESYAHSGSLTLKVGKCGSDSFLGTISKIDVHSVVLSSDEILSIHIESINSPTAVPRNGDYVTSHLSFLDNELVGEWLDDPLVGESLSRIKAVLGTRDGLTDYTGNSVGFTVTNGIVGNGVVLDNGAINWPEAEFESYSYVFEANDGSGIKFCSYSEGVHRVNLVEGAAPLTITSTGMSAAASGKIYKIEAYNNNIPFHLLKLLYLKESRYF